MFSFQTSKTRYGIEGINGSVIWGKVRLSKSGILLVTSAGDQDLRNLINVQIIFFGNGLRSNIYFWVNLRKRLPVTIMP